ncbi:MAG: hypothetical protein AAGF79_02575 [Pseudomonadota bacterium]
MTAAPDVSMPATVRDPLSIALVLPADWRGEPGIARLLDTLSGAAHVQIAACVDPNAPVPEPSGVLRGWLACEEALLGRPGAPATPRFDAQAATLPRCTVETMPDVDAVLDLQGTGDPSLAARGRFGLWRLSATAPDAGLAPALSGAGETPVALLTLAAPDAAWRVRAQTAYDTKFLASRNRRYLREKAVQLIERELAVLSMTRTDAPPLPSSGQTAPVSSALLPGYVLRAGGQVARRLRDRVRAKANWRPGRFCLRLGTGSALDFDPAASVEFDAPDGTYWADPFLIDHALGRHVFFEVYDYATDRGHIAAARVEGRNLVPLGPVLQTPYHLSYPFVFAHDGEIFMLPETHQSDRLELWRATEFPVTWTLHSTALEGTACADSVVVEHEGRWWLFTNICRDSYGDFCSELHVFAIDGPQMGRIAPHPLNPVVVGSRTARGGGRVFAQNGRLYRAAQDNAFGTYGYGLRIMEITALGPTEYEERTVRHLTPDSTDLGSDLIGLHHVDALGGQVIFDVRRR